MNNASFQQLEATSLYCPHCKVAVPVRKRLLIVLPEGDKFEYLCSHCASSLGSKVEPHGKENKLII
ncbi:MAG: cytoplasmic protein [Deltaproteobacteria bacterium CG12_big_fil_rev_8_21_14_0_65_43_10]|nr:MAG: hypothetical protein AUK23_09990 [Deltaproteobacteria bacterium CG2_30_43_15]PIQ45443.1 MAG: cytoplasmic protein [Deltaproteobacteria bacterium CG12_big_fil_rev_8_21_14_0_65_43_10]PIU84414.1 MAG: cytoplasmic protein [Deltaproteobacteria bacterium CG06_land_8_20_14_3_00_44_19]PIX25385.1 MAG: cytoplasmic protein [Deltaproteobacteria bacterium CG_4_8_14_3_um_filter_43_13]PIZ20261.1 MAG: cytoplasmic protein [Deltaproteobacteria bacterium CG_4_10_14_0_8_um_filter_43_12]PJB43497.1 MAG: cytop